MQVVYAREPISSAPTPRIFLAGPTPRSTDVASWRPAALTLLKEKGFEGSVLVPEARSHEVYGDYDHQIEWEGDGLLSADVILFWIPREMKTMPALTTNVEFGLWVASGKVVAGAPPWAEKVRYLEKTAERFDVPWSQTLGEVIEETLKRLPDGSSQA